MVVLVLFSLSNAQQRRWTDKKRCLVASNACLVGRWSAGLVEVAGLAVVVDELDRSMNVVGAVLSTFLFRDRIVGSVEDGGVLLSGALSCCSCGCGGGGVEVVVGGAAVRDGDLRRIKSIKVLSFTLEYLA